MKFEKVTVEGNVLCYLCWGTTKAEAEVCRFVKSADDDNNEIWDYICMGCIEEMSKLMPSCSVPGKPYVGKLFYITNQKSHFLLDQPNGRSCYPNKHPPGENVKRELLPQAVMIIDQRTRYLAFFWEGKKRWLPRGYFGKEMVKGNE